MLTRSKMDNEPFKYRLGNGARNLCLRRVARHGKLRTTRHA